jgi:hypothetical protein
MKHNFVKDELENPDSANREQFGLHKYELRFRKEQFV